MNRNNRIGGSFGYSRRASSTSGSNERHNTSIIELLDSDDDDDDADAGLWAAPSIFASSSSSAVKREGSSSINSGRGISTATAPRSGNSGGSSFSAAKVNDKAERKGLGREGGGGGGASTASTTAGAAADVATGPSTSSDASTSVQTPLGHLDVRCEETTADASASSSEQAMLVDPPSGTAVCFRRITEFPDRKTIQVLIASNSTRTSTGTYNLEVSGPVVGLVHSSDAQWLAPILDRLLSRQLAYTASLLPRPAPGRMAVRIHFVGQNPTRRLSKFELNPLERSLSFYLRPHGKSLVKPPPTLKTPPSAAAAAVAAGVENSRANARSTEEADDDDEAEQQLQTLLGRWRCHLVDAVAIPSTSVVHPSSAVLQVKVKADPRRSGNAVAPEAPKNQVVLRRNTEQDTNKPPTILVEQDGIAIASLSHEHATALSIVWDEYHASLDLQCQLIDPADPAAARAHSDPPRRLEVSVSSTLKLAATLQKLLQYHLPGFEANALSIKERIKSAKSHQSGESTHDLVRLMAEHDVQVSTADWEAQKAALDEMFDQQSRAQIADLPLYPMPALLQPSGGTQQLFQHQIDGIRWLIHQEQIDVPSYIATQQLDTGQTIWKCRITHTIFRYQPPNLRGGILADDMGLGKTLQTLGLILANPPKGLSYPRNNAHLAARSKMTQRGGRGVPTCTLIVCPLTVIANWEHQILLHVNGRVRNTNLRVDTYHGPKRDAKLLLVQQDGVDILVTSYHTLASDYRKWMDVDDDDRKNGGDKKIPKLKKQRKGPFIFDIEFHRVILDEAHIVRSSSTGLWKAVMNLRTQRKLCLTGTPFVNKPTDIHSLLCFLQVQPLCRANQFKKMVVEPIKCRKEIGLATIRTTMAYVALRRKKESVLEEIQLVDKSVLATRIQFDPDSDHCQTYEVLYNTVRAYFVKLLNDKDKSLVFQHWMEIISLVLRIRQACVHMSLVPEEYRRRAHLQLEHLKKSTGLGREEGEQLLEFLKGAFGDAPLVECAVCLDEMEEDNAVILRSCKHIFCGPCLSKIENSICPMCRQEYTPDDMIQKREAKAATTVFSAKDSLEKHGRSPKIQALFNHIEEMKPDEKAVIFSQWTSVLDIVELEFNTYGHNYTRIDGTMDTFQRLEAVLAFETEGTTKADTPRFILCSIMACGAGINLTRGNVVFILDPWWNAAAEVQAMDRVHRIGQIRPVRVYRLLMKDSIEERMVALQVNKQLLGKGSMEKLKEEEKRKARLTALIDLFNVTTEEGGWH